MKQPLQHASEAPGEHEAQGPVYLDSWEGRLVYRLREDEADIETNWLTWIVQDVLTGERYVVPNSELTGRPLNEMQVLAFMADAGTCSCCGADACEIVTINFRDLCKSCYRSSCDTKGPLCQKENR